MQLTDLAKPPTNFTFVPDERLPGTYIVGLDKFLLADFHMTNILQRQFTPAEEYILGILSVFLIAILSDIAQTLLLRTTNRHLHLNSLLSAYMVHELSHFRNIWSHIKPAQQDAVRAHRALLTRRRALMSVIVLSVTFGLFAADVIAVLLTQPHAVSSKEHEYNLVAVQPTATNLGLSRLVRRLTGDRPCVSPIMTGSEQRRNFRISACIQFMSSEALSKPDDVSDVITIASWFHRGGSDHNITVTGADSTATAVGSFNIKLRAELLLDEPSGGGRRFLFQSQDDAELTHTRYLHELVLYGAMDWACRNTETRTCQELAEDFELSSRIERERIKLWRGKKDDVFTEVDGLVSTSRVGLNAPYRALNSGLRALVSSAAIMEVEGAGSYVRVANDREEEGIAGLLTEDGRVAGVVLFGVIFGVLVLTMITLRVWLKPVSLGYVAVSGVQQAAGVELLSEDYFQGVQDTEYWDYMSGLGAGGMQSASGGSYRRRGSGDFVDDMG